MREHDVPEPVTGSELATLRKQALQIIHESLQDTRTQHPLDIPEIFKFDRPTLGDVVPIKLYRSIRLLAFREVLGSRISAALLSVIGRSVAKKMGIQSIPSLLSTLEDLSIGRTTIDEQADDRVILSNAECVTCSGVPNIGEPLCHFEAGFIASGLEQVLGGRFKVVEINCWGLGDRICRYEAKRVAGKNGSDTLDILMQLASRASLAMENGIAVRQKNRELTQAYQQLRESDRLKKDLTDMIVHDMRVPLTVVLGSLENLTEAMGQLAPKDAKCLELAYSSTHQLVQMVEDLLDISKIEEQKVNLKKVRVPVAELVELAVKQAGMLAWHGKVQLSAEVNGKLPDLVVDRNRVVRILVNLLSNAAQHTPEGGRVSLFARFQPVLKEVQFSVSDTGEGIPKEYHHKIFDKFVQVESAKSRKRSSSGLGLTFCKLVTEAHGGSIWVDSEPGVGSTFTATFPVE